MEVRETGGQPVLDGLTAFLREKRLLLVLDNVEQVAAAAPLVTTLLEHAPHLKVLVTSRVRLRLRGEHEYPVPALVLPDLRHLPQDGSLSQFAAVTLFIQRAREVKPDFQVTNQCAPAIAELCLRLDGLPLAIELAAARSKVLTPQAMLARLDRPLPLLTGGPRDAPARQQTIRSAIQWSYDLLSREGQRLFRRLTAFVGGWTLEAAEAVAMGSDEQASESSTASPRSWMRVSWCSKTFPMARCASGCWRQSTISGWGNSLSLARIARCGVGTPPTSCRWPSRWSRSCVVRTSPHGSPALSATTATCSPPSAMPSRTAPSRRPCALRERSTATGMCEGTSTRALRLLQSLLPLQGQAPPRARARVLHAAGMLAWERLQFDVAVSLLEQSLALFSAVGDRYAAASVLRHLGHVARVQAQVAQAEWYYTESLALARNLGDERGLAGAQRGLGLIAYGSGDLDRAATLFAESRDRFERLGDVRNAAVTLTGLGDVVLAQHELAVAAAHYHAGLLRFREVGDRGGAADALAGFAQIALARGDAIAAVSLLAAAVTLRRETGGDIPPTVAKVYVTIQTAARAVLSEDVYRDAWTHGEAMSVDAAIGFALSSDASGVEPPPAPR